MKIAFWSPTPFAGRKSTNLLLLALQSIVEEGGEQLILHADPMGSGPEHFFLSGTQRSRMMQRNEFGIEHLMKMLHCERFSKESAINASYTFVEGKLHILPAGSERFYADKDIAAGEIINLIRCADEVFQNVWVELPAGESEFSQKILSEVDGVVVNLGQSPYEISKIERLPHFDREVYILGAYESHCIYSVHNLMLMFPRLRGKCMTIPFHTGLFVAGCEGSVEDFRMREVNQKETRESPSFFRMLEKNYRRISEGWTAVSCGERKGKK